MADSTAGASRRRRIDVKFTEDRPLPRRKLHDRNEEPSPGAIGGAAGEAGSAFRAAVGAWFVVHALAGKPVTGLGCDSLALVPSGVVLPESDAAVDDIEIDLDGGGHLFVQAKRALSISRDPGSEFAGVVAQWRALAGDANCFDAARDRMVLAVGTLTRPLRALRNALARLQAVRAGAPTGEEREVLGDVRALLADLDPALAERILRSVDVLLLDFVDSAHLIRGASEGLLAGVVPPTEASRAWEVIEGRLKKRAAQRLGAGVKDWMGWLRLGGIELVADATGVRSARLEAERREKLQRLERWEADLAEIRTTVGDVEVPRAGVVTQLRLALAEHPVAALVGPSGMGKSTVLIRLRPDELDATYIVRLRAKNLEDEHFADRLAQLTRLLIELRYGAPVLLIDALDGVLGGDRDQALLPVARVARELTKANPPWRVVLACTEERWDEAGSLLRGYKLDLLQSAIIEVGPFAGPELEVALAPHRARIPPVVVDRASRLLADPWACARLIDLLNEGDLPDEVFGEARLGDLWWGRVLGRLDPRGTARRAAIQLAVRLADERRDECEPHRLPLGELEALEPLIRKGIVRERAGRISLGHDRYADLGRVRFLVDAAEAGDLAAWETRRLSLRWRAALRLAALHLVELAPDVWMQCVSRLDPDRAADQDLLHLLTEALWRASRPDSALDAVLPLLLQREGTVLRTFCRRLVEAAEQPAGDGRPAGQTAPLETVWPAVSAWLVRHRVDVLQAHPRAVLRLIAWMGLWVPAAHFDATVRAEFGASIGALVDSSLQGRSGFDDQLGIDETLVRTFLGWLGARPDAERQILRVLCGRLERPLRPKAPLRPARNVRLPPAIPVWSGPPEDAPSSPWPDGPVAKPVDAFATVAVTAEGAAALLRFDPMFAVEVFLALVIEPPRSRVVSDYPGQRHFGRELPGFLEVGHTGAGFIPLYALFAASPLLGALFVVRVLAFASTAMSAYAAETGSLPTEVVRLTTGTGEREYVGGAGMWGIAREPSMGRIAGSAAQCLRETLASDLDEATRCRIHALLLACPSTAALSLLVEEAIRRPELFEGHLEALIHDPQPYWWACREHGKDEGGPLYHAVRRRWFARDRRWPALEGARRSWLEGLADGRWPQHDRHWVGKLIAWFDRDRWAEVTDEQGRRCLAWSPDDAQAAETARLAQESKWAFGPLMVWGEAHQALERGGPLPRESALSLLDRAEALPVEHGQTLEARTLVAAVLVQFALPVLEDDRAAALVTAWLTQALLFEPDGHSKHPSTGFQDAVRAAARLWCWRPSAVDLRAMVGNCAGCSEPEVVRGLVSTLAHHRRELGSEFGRVLHLGVACAVLPGPRDFEDPDSTEALAAYRAGRVAEFVAGRLPPLPPGLLSSAPQPIDGVGLPRRSFALIDATATWLRDAGRSPETDALVAEVDVLLRDFVAARVKHAIESGRTRATCAADCDDNPDGVDRSLLRTLVRWILVEPGWSDSAVMTMRWVDAAQIPPKWAAAFLDALFAEACRRPREARQTMPLILRAAGHSLDEPRWRTYRGGPHSDLLEVLLGVPDGGYGIESRWSAETTPLLNLLEQHHVRWVERARDERQAFYWLARLGCVDAATGNRARFARWMASFPEGARGEKWTSAFLPLLLRDPSRKGAEVEAEVLLNDLRAVGDPRVGECERALSTRSGGGA